MLHGTDVKKRNPILYLREQELKDPWLFFEAERGPQTKTFGKHWVGALLPLPLCARKGVL
jgi:hypothetical protein